MGTRKQASTPETSQTPVPVESRLALEHVEEALRGLRFGQVTVIVQDGVVVQIERTEKKRIV